jgi:hypothetical protein
MLPQPGGHLPALATFTNWRRSDDRFSQAEIRETRQIIQDYYGMPERAKARAGNRALGWIPTQPVDLFRPQPQESATVAEIQLHFRSPM